MQCLPGRNFFRSVRFRMILLILIIGLVPGTILKHFIIKSYQNSSVETLEVDARGEGSILCGALGSADFPESLAEETIDQVLLQYAGERNGRVLIVDDEFVVLKDTLKKDIGKTMLSDLVINCFEKEDGSYFDEKHGVLQLALPIYREKDVVGGAMLVSIPADRVTINTHKISREMDIVLLVLLFVCIIYAFLSTYLMNRPFRRLGRSIQAVADGSQDELKIEETFSETEQISQSCRQMVDRLNALDESRQQFVSNVSHELKTPLTSMKVLSDAILLQEHAPEEMYREFMSDLSEEIERENKIINNLLTLVKMDKNSSSMEISQVGINDMVERVLKLLRPIAASCKVDLTYESVRPVTAEIDETKLSLAIMNLVENAIKYNRKHGWVNVVLNADHQNFFLEIADSGRGIPEEDIPHIFERFYRVDKSRSDEVKGTGLGLAITRSIIKMHRGTVQVFSKEGEGTTITVKIPLIYSISEAGDHHEK